jgi:putative redox protein
MQDYQMLAGNGHSEWLLDEPAGKGGGDTGPTPMETLLSALGSCMAITGRMYARHKGWEIRDVQVSLRLEGNEPGGTPVIRHDIRLEGDLDEEQRERVLKIMHKCPVAKLMAQGVSIE